MNPWKVILATIVIFGAGVITGALVLQATVGPYGMRPQRFATHPEFGTPGGMRFDFLRRMQRDLDLTAEQRDRIDKILKQSQERTRKIMEPCAPQLRQEVQRAKAEFRGVLTQEQQARFDALLKQQQHFREQHRWPRPESGLTNSAATNAM